MSILRFRLTAADDGATRILDELESEDVVEHIVDTNELMPGMADDSSSAGLPDDEGPASRNIEVHLAEDADSEAEGRIRRRLDLAAAASGGAIEYVDEF